MHGCFHSALAVTFNSVINDTTYSKIQLRGEKTCKNELNQNSVKQICSELMMQKKYIRFGFTEENM
jgi:hypothetical protein